MNERIYAWMKERIQTWNDVFSLFLLKGIHLMQVKTYAHVFMCEVSWGLVFECGP